MGKLLNLLLGSAWSYVAGAAMIAMVVGGIYAKGHHDGTRAMQLAQLEQQAKQAAEIAKVEKAARQLDAAAAKEAADRRYELQQRIKDLDTYVEKLEDANRVCLSERDTDRLRNLWDN